MDLNWREKLFNQNLCQGKVINEGEGDILVEGNVESIDPNPSVIFWAPSPPTRGSSFNGSGLPYPNPEIAYDKTPNVGMVKAPNRKFAFRIKYPSAYYSALGTGYIPPIVNIKVCEEGQEDKVTAIKIDDGIPFRSLTHIGKHRVEKYRVPEQEVRTQEQILRSSSYPSENKMPDNFWGDKPPL
jgi:hypothetical protein